jgi:hypothetical protein
MLKTKRRENSEKDHSITQSRAKKIWNESFVVGGAGRGARGYM